MKNKFMKKIWLLWGIIALVWACDTEQKVIDTGVSNPYFDGTIMDYLRSNDKNWDLTVEMIEHADLTDLFEGQVDTWSGNYVLGSACLFYFAVYAGVAESCGSR